MLLLVSGNTSKFFLLHLSQNPSSFNSSHVFENAFALKVKNSLIVMVQGVSFLNSPFDFFNIAKWMLLIKVANVKVISELFLEL